MKTYLYTIKVSFLRFLQYPIELASEFAKRFFQVAFMALFWSLVIQANPGVIDYQKVILYFVMVTSVSDIIMADRLEFGRFISTNIKSGSLNTVLIRPLGTLRYLYSYVLGSLLPNSFFAILGIFLVIVINPPQGILQIIFSTVFVLLACVLSYSINLLVGIVAFVTTETTFLEQATQQVIRILSGSFIPLYFYPDAIMNILTLTPFPYLVFEPINILLSNNVSMDQIGKSLVIIVMWTILLNIVSYYLWKRLLKNYEAIGI